MAGRVAIFVKTFRIKLLTFLPTSLLLLCSYRGCHYSCCFVAGNVFFIFFHRLVGVVWWCHRSIYLCHHRGTGVVISPVRMQETFTQCHVLVSVFPAMVLICLNLGMYFFPFWGKIKIKFGAYTLAAYGFDAHMHLWSCGG